MTVLGDGRAGDGTANQVFKCSPEGEILLTLGEPGVTDTGPRALKRYVKRPPSAGAR